MSYIHLIINDKKNCISLLILNKMITFIDGSESYYTGIYWLYTTYAIAFIQARESCK